MGKSLANTCELCGKRRLVGNRVSHAHNKTKRVSMPNIKVVRAIVNGATRRLKVCTRCIRSGKIKKAS